MVKLGYVLWFDHNRNTVVLATVSSGGRYLSFNCLLPFVSWSAHHSFTEVSFQDCVCTLCIKSFTAGVTLFLEYISRKNLLVCTLFEILAPIKTSFIYNVPHLCEDDTIL